MPLPPFANRFHEGSFAFLGETVRLVHVLSGIFDQSWRCRRPLLAMFLVNTGKRVDSDAFTFGLCPDLYAIV